MFRNIFNPIKVINCSTDMTINPLLTRDCIGTVIKMFLANEECDNGQ